MDYPTVGRVVHFVLPGGEHRPAFIVKVWPGEFGNDEVKDGVNLQVFIDGTNDGHVGGDCTLEEGQKGMVWRTSVRYAATPGGTGLPPGTWHWPERKD